ncbi:glycosyltransferase family 2 protein [Priestia taiwanensis]|uniref:Glycosyl transferase n=1 Tax=Priestia taiwanensis TaxID=1347902 RepID=A0A917AWF1_9BACI|nr:glycosyltransferase family 2 protein [Priestia taiwanensis]MBM7363366.1 cellulose synthase/poly-beta-1,6-N-acetylglucosamine synthase-like glycosyltransferase [Priestia taiwanensis]GGE77752.1 glycosyl transferase [Priestia taiwanensis]
MKKPLFLFFSSLLIWTIGYMFTEDALHSLLILGNIFLMLIQLYMIWMALYNTALGYLGLRKYKPLILTTPKHRFAVIVAAHNEEKVVGSIVKNLQKQEYPQELYDVYVICDNCTDKTAAVVRSHGGNAMERFDTTKRGKGFALEWMFTKLWEMEAGGTRYDAVVVFDADNIVSRNFLHVMNTKMDEGFEVVQGYLDSKNPEDTWVTKSYSFAYWSTNRIYQLGRDNLGLSAQLGGTGLLVATNVLKKIGWNATSLTEDLEFTQRYIIETGRRIGWAHEAITYDEKPLGLLASLKQRVRWMAGHSDCTMRYTLPLLKQFVKTRSLIPFDSVMYLIGPARFILILFFMLFSLLSFLKLADIYTPLDSILEGLTLLHPAVYITVFACYFSLPLLAIILEKKASKLHWFFFSYLFGFTWIPVTLMGFIKRKNRVWSHTEHVRNVDEDDLENI